MDKKAVKNEILWILSGDTTVMFELLADNPDISDLADQVVNGKAKYSELLALANESF